MNKSRAIAIVLFVFAAGSVSFAAHAQTPLESLRDRAVNLGRQIMGSDAPVLGEEATSGSEEEIGALRERLRNRVARPDVLQAAREERRAGFEGTVAERQSQFAERIAQVTEQKRQIAEHVFSQLAEIKKRMLGQFSEMIDRLDAVVAVELNPALLIGLGGHFDLDHMQRTTLNWCVAGGGLHVGRHWRRCNCP